MIGATPEATAEIWRFVLDIDWYATSRRRCCRSTIALFLLLATPRRVKFRVGDSLWVRLVDVGAALSGREYAGDGSIVFEVHDAVCPWNEGRWKLEGGQASRTEERRSSRSASTRSGRPISARCRSPSSRNAGRVEELADGAVRRADALFRWRPLPWCPEIF